MMNRLLIAVLLIMTAALAFAQVPDWQWAQRFGNYDYDYGYDLATDAAGNVYLAGAFSASAQFGDTTLNSAGSMDVAVVSYDANGNVNWAVRGGGTGNDVANSVAVASNGDVYIQGTFFSTATFGTHSVSSGGQSDIFVAKLNSAGEWQWAISASTFGTDTAGQIALDSEGNAYVTGTIWGDATLGTIYLPTIGYKDVFVAKVSSGGSWIWANLAGGTNSDEGWGIAIDGSGDIYISGTVFQSVTFGPFSYTTNHNDAFVAKLNNIGEWQWLSTSNGSAPEYAENLCLDATGNIFIGGYYYTDSWYAPHFGAITPPELGTHTMYVAKLSSTGSWVWVKGAGALLTANGYSSQNNKVKSLISDATGNVWVTGAYEGNAQFDGLTVPTMGGVDGFLAKLDGAGNWLNVESFGGASSDWGYGVALDASDNAFVTGFNSGTISFGDISLVSAGSYDGFIAGFGQAGTAAPQIETDLSNLDFGNVPVNSYATLALEIINTGSAALEISGVNISNPAFITRLPGELSFPLDLEPEETQHLYVDFLPTSLQLYEGSLQILSNDPLTPSLQISLSGSGYNLVADFEAQPLSGDVPLEVQFTDQSSGNISDWLWDFGDGSISIQQHPLHTYTSGGTYSVTLTVYDQDLSVQLTRMDYIQATTRPLIASPQSAGLDYGIVALGSSANLNLVIQSTGSEELTIQQIDLSGQPSAFSFTPPALPLVLLPGTELALDISFTPSQSGIHLDQLTSQSNADNLPSLTIGLSGEGQYVAPAMVQNVNVEIQDQDALITWDPVTESESGTPLVPDRYIVLYNETPYEQDQFYYYLASTTGTSFTHQEVALFRTQMFYRVVAVKFYRDADAAWLDGISSSDKLNWGDLKSRWLK